MNEFDHIIDRSGSDSLKYDLKAIRTADKKVIPLWVADMDFQAPAAVLTAMERRIQHGIFGYSHRSESYFTALQNWLQSRHDYTIQAQWLVETPGVVFAICMAIRTLTQAGQSVLVQTPVYPPLFESVRSNNRHLVTQPLVFDGQSYHIDFEDFENKIQKHDVKLFILCSPHNPVGRVWTREELHTMGDICYRHGVYICSDEIHADFTFPGHRHTVFASLDPRFEKQTITCTAPSKTFNLAALQISNILVADAKIRARFKREIEACGYSSTNVLGMIACESAYTHGHEWLDSLLDYLHGNLIWIQEFFRTHIPEIRIVTSEGTYLVWLDCRSLNLDSNQLNLFFRQEAKLWLSPGPSFGTQGSGFQRLNLACPRAVLQKAALQLRFAVKKRFRSQ